VSKNSILTFLTRKFKTQPFT